MYSSGRSSRDQQLPDSRLHWADVCQRGVNINTDVFLQSALSFLHFSRGGRRDYSWGNLKTVAQNFPLQLFRQRLFLFLRFLFPVLLSALPALPFRLSSITIVLSLLKRDIAETTSTLSAVLQEFRHRSTNAPIGTKWQATNCSWFRFDICTEWRIWVCGTGDVIFILCSNLKRVKEEHRSQKCLVCDKAGQWLTDGLIWSMKGHSIQNVPGLFILRQVLFALDQIKSYTAVEATKSKPDSRCLRCDTFHTLPHRIKSHDLWWRGYCVLSAPFPPCGLTPREFLGPAFYVLLFPLQSTGQGGA